MYIQDHELKIQEYAFHQRKNLPWELKLYLTKQRIEDWSRHWDGDVYISFSGGLDSTVLLHLVREVLGDDVPAVFCNTGLEYPELVSFVNTFENVEILRPDKPFNKVIKEYGYPVVSKEVAAKIRKLRNGNLSDRYRNYLLNGDERGKFGMLPKKWRFLLDAPFESSERCCDVMKKNPFKKYHRETGRQPFVGVTQDEGYIRARQYNKTGCNVYDGGTIKSQPLGFWNKQDVLRYVVENELEISTIYGEIVCNDGIYSLTGEQRTGCMFCAFGAHLEKEPNRFQRMQKTHPKQYKYCMENLGMEEVLEHIDVAYKDDGQIKLY